MDDRLLAAIVQMLQSQNDVPLYPDDLINALADAGLKNERKDLLQYNMKQAEQDQNTAMPQGLTVRDQYIAPSPLAVGASTLKQILGGQDQMRLQQQYADLLKQYASTAADKYRFDAASQRARNAQMKPARPTIPGAFSPPANDVYDNTGP